jgi:GNAT superfamily N-acetyltransferase
VNACFVAFANAPYFEGGNDNIVLVQQSDTFFKAYQIQSQGPHSLDPLHTWYDQGNFYDDLEEDGKENLINKRPILYHPTVDRPIKDMFGNKVSKTPSIPDGLIEKTKSFQARFLIGNPQWKKLLSPTVSDIKNRHKVFLESFSGFSAFNDRLVALLGQEHDRTLKLDGIIYHSPTWIFPDHKNSHRYILAHNGQEVMGLVHYIHREHDNGLAFISVAPGFRQQGVSQKLYQVLLQECEQDRCLLKRTEPGEYSLANPGITRGYDRLLNDQSRALHVSGYGSLYSALLQALSQHTYENVLQAGKAICDRAMKQRVTDGAFGFDQRQHDQEAAEMLKQNLKQMDAQEKPGRKKIRP